MIGAHATNQDLSETSELSRRLHRVVAIVGDAGLSKSFKVQTRLFLWGLLVVILFMLGLLLLAITRYFRERRRRKEEAGGAAPLAADGTEDAPPTGEVPAVGEPVAPAWPRSPDRRIRLTSHWRAFGWRFLLADRVRPRDPAWEDRRGLPYDVALI